jgi:hypothetical protein
VENLSDEKNECAGTKERAVKHFELLIGRVLGDFVLFNLSSQLLVLDAYVLNHDFELNNGCLKLLLLD